MINLTSLCHDSLWDWDALWHRNQPKVSECLQFSVRLIPCAVYLLYYLVFILPRIIFRRLEYRSPIWIYSPCIFVSQLLFHAVFFGLLVLELVLIFEQQHSTSDHVADIITLANGVLMATTLLSFTQVVMNYKWNRPVEMAPFMLWLGILISAVPRTFQLVQDAVHVHSVDPAGQLWVTSGRLVCTIALIVLSALPAGRSPEYAHDKICPEQLASPFSRLMFWWLWSQIWQAYKRELSTETIFELHTSDSAEVNYTRFQQLWNCEMVKFRSRKLRAEMRRRHRSSSASSLPGSARKAEDRRQLLSVQEEDNDDGNVHGSLPEVQFRQGQHDNPSMAMHGNNEASSSSSSPTTANSTMNEDDKAKQRKSYEGPSLLKVLIMQFGSPFILIWFAQLLHDLLLFGDPVILKYFLQYMDDPKEPQWHGYVYVLGFFFCVIGSSAVYNQAIFAALKISLRLRSALIAAIHKKALTLCNESRQKSTVGEIVNLMSVDADRISSICVYLLYPWSVVMQIVLALYLLYQELSYSIFVGVGVLVVFMLVNSVLITQEQKYEDKEMELKDERIKTLSELLNGIKFIKLYAWELSFQARVCGIRARELGYLLRTYAIWGVISVIWDVVPFLLLLSTFLVYVYTGGGGSHQHVLSPERAFVSLTLLNMLRFPMVMLPGQISIYVNAYVSLKRLNRFFCEGDIDLSGYERDVTPSKDATPAISMKNATFSWTTNGKPVLNNLNIDIVSRSLVAVVGKVGVGKSSFLSAILGEMRKQQGFVSTKGRIGYVPQEAWLQNASLRDNILFGQPFDEERYRNVVKACALEPDLALLPAGDATEIGERGINLSGGQKQRISLARAVYQNLDIYLLDDPVSAVDAHVGEHLFNHVIGPQGLLKDKTRIFVTHSIRWLPYVSRILVLDDAHRVSEDGTYQELMSSGQAFADFLKTYQKKPEDDEDDDNSSTTPGHSVDGSRGGSVPPTEHAIPRTRGRRISENVDQNSARSVDGTPSSYRVPAVGSFDETADAMARPPRPQRYHSTTSTANSQVGLGADGTRHRRESVLSHEMVLDGALGSFVASDEVEPGVVIRQDAHLVSQELLIPPSGGSAAQTTGNDGAGLQNRLTEDEVVESGRVSLRAYGSYLRAAGLSCIWSVVLGQSLFHVVEVGSNIWLKEFTQDAILANLTGQLPDLNDSSPTYDTVIQAIRARVDWYMLIYGGFGILQFLLCTCFICLSMAASYRASRLLHSRLLGRILRAPLAFFDTTPSGRVVNRFSRDIETVDHQLPSALNDTLGCVTSLVACIGVITWSTPWFLLVIAPLSCLYFFIQLVYVPISRQSRRLDSITRSPIFTHFGETVAGAAVIRAFSQQSRFQEHSNELINLNARFFYVKWSSNRWLGLHMDCLSSCIVASAAFLAILSRGQGVTAALAGLSVSYALQVTDTLMWLIRQIAELETDAVSLERVKEYTQVEQEPDWNVANVDDDPRMAQWPSQGAIRITNYSLRYRPHLPLVLHQLTADIRPGERIGVVGRTGAGKSSLTLALFRVVEAAEGSGGVIEIDGEDIGRLGLHLLRSRITILPQDPVLFSGTLRSNLDPFERHTDDELWEALECSHLATWVKAQPLQLAHECGEGGNNLSAGQRQLMCLARAILRRSRVLVLDEATAAVDLHTDKLLMHTVREYFKDATIIIIAHRLATIMDADRVMVLDNGRIAQFASPKELLQQKNGIFYQLARNAGLKA